MNGTIDEGIIDTLEKIMNELKHMRLNMLTIAT